MAEYIEREALLKWFEPYLGTGETWVEIHPVLDAVHALPAADVVEVVRCKDCWSATELKGFMGGGLYCPILCRNVESDFFCADGARMDGE